MLLKILFNIKLVFKMPLNDIKMNKYCKKMARILRNSNFI